MGQWLQISTVGDSKNQQLSKVYQTICWIIGLTEGLTIETSDYRSNSRYSIPILSVMNIYIYIYVCLICKLTCLEFVKFGPYFVEPVIAGLDPRHLNPI
jgi:hypothetical protein